MSQPHTLTRSQCHNELLPSATKLRRLCFYTCLWFCSRGGCAIPACLAAGLRGAGGACCRGGACSWEGVPASGRGCLLPGGACSGKCEDPPPPKQTASVADGTHLTGMHPCFKSYWNHIVYWKVMCCWYWYGNKFYSINIVFFSIILHIDDLYSVRVVFRNSNWQKSSRTFQV